MKSSKRLAKSSRQHIVPSSPKSHIEALVAWDAMAKPAYSHNTQRAWAADGAVFQLFCERAGATFFPAIPDTVRLFIIDCLKRAKKPATIRRYVATITRAHQAAGLVSPSLSEPVRLALREMGMKTSARQRQAMAIG